MHLSFLAETVRFPMNFLLPLAVLGAVVMAVIELIRKDRYGPAFWAYFFSALVFMAFGWPPQFMQGSPDQQVMPAHTAPEAAAAVASSR